MLVGLGWLGSGWAAAQAPPRPDAAAIQLALKKLQFLGSALYVAAHPDDENTRLIAWLANGKLADTAYLAMTRGDGGQNLIGSEIGPELGIIRSQELLAARRTDGGRQFFTRAIDFGFSKSPEETMRIWDADKVLADTVRVYREFQPDVVITRFPTNDRDTHGHHTTSARMASDAYAAAGDPKRYPEQVPTWGTWRPKRLLWNTSRWFYDKPEDFKPETLMSVDVGGFSPLLGESYPELAARSRSMHRSQGFGSGGQRGEVLEYLQPVDGDKSTGDLFEGVDTTWGRVPGGKPVGELLERAYRDYRPEEPSAIVPTLLEARAKLRALPAGRWTTAKSADLDRLIAACLGLYLEASAETPTAAPGDALKINLEAVNRSRVAVTMKRVAVGAPGGAAASGAAGGAAAGGAASAPFATDAWEQPLELRQGAKKALDTKLPESLVPSQPYWLREKGALGIFRVDDPALIGLPENPPALVAQFDLDVAGTPFTIARPVVHKWTDPARGERYRPFEVVPVVAVEIAGSVFVLPPEKTSHEVTVRLRAGRAKVDGSVRLETPEGWSATPASQPFTIAERDATATVSFTLRPPANPSVGTLRAVAESGGKKYTRGLTHIEYDHIPTQVVMPAAEARVVRADLKRKGQKIAYVQGAGDSVPAGLEEIGYDVTTLTQDELTPERLKGFDAVVLGVRACNTLERIRFAQPALFAYVKAGGTLIVQYTTGHELKVDNVAPVPLSISRDRVSEEDAEVRFLAPDHPVLNVPNKITAADFQGWVQERGLYFADKWDGAFTPILSSNDAGEPPRDGGLLVAKVGEGYFVYTGYSFFRELPAGVPGAYRLFANLIALGN
ncbi:MAG TPA: PIG-L family deacetylase [Candidatus Polarisedimenticolia bacterium]|nr:PIG-L family deacetylase [Candidatus Polarisedimenticolia bacterium]